MVPLLDIQGVSVVRGGRPILDDITFSIAQGEHVAILGPNGCGKSTLIRVLTHELYPHGGRGSVKVLGEDRWVVRDLRTKLAVVSDEPREPLLGPPTVRQLAVSGLIGTYAVTWGYEVSPEMWAKADAALEFVEIGHLAGRDMDTLSAGEHRRAFIARALVSDPIGLVLDEPTNSLDIRSRHEFLGTMRRIAASGKTLLLVTHHLEEVVPEIERVILLRSGRVVFDGPVDQGLTSEKVSDLFGMPVTVRPDPWRADVR